LPSNELRPKGFVSVQSLPPPTPPPLFGYLHSNRARRGVVKTGSQSAAERVKMAKGHQSHLAILGIVDCYAKTGFVEPCPRLRALCDELARRL